MNFGAVVLGPNEGIVRQADHFSFGYQFLTRRLDLFCGYAMSVVTARAWRRLLELWLLRRRRSLNCRTNPLLPLLRGFRSGLPLNPDVQLALTCGCLLTILALLLNALRSSRIMLCLAAGSFGAAGGFGAIKWKYLAHRCASFVEGATLAVPYEIN
jgi:hypothetical protein